MDVSEIEFNRQRDKAADVQSPCTNSIRRTRNILKLIAEVAGWHDEDPTYVTQTIRELCGKASAELQPQGAQA